MANLLFQGVVLQLIPNAATMLCMHQSIALALLKLNRLVSEACRGERHFSLPPVLGLELYPWHVKEEQHSNKNTNMISSLS